jgi:iron-sulfur cluster biosynthesis transcriptional regulator SufR
MKEESESRTRARDRVLFQLKTKGERTSAQLARRLDVTPMAIRQHLAALEAEGLVAHSKAAHGVGRPARLWNLTPAAAKRFPDSHSDLTVDLLESMQDTFGDKGLARLLAVRAKRQLASYRERMPGLDSPLDKRVGALAKLRREEGYMAEWSRTKGKGGAFTLLENHCPICAAAQTCQGLCRDELQLFRALLPDAKVDRVEHILEGARRCAYRIIPQ